MVVTRAVTSAMAQQVDRVNLRLADADLRDRVRELEEDLRIAERQRDAFARRNGELITEREQLLTELAQLKHPTVISSFTIDNRPVMTPEQAANWTGVSVSTVSRYVSTGFWAATQQPGSNRWYIFTDVPLVKKERGRARRAD